MTIEAEHSDDVLRRAMARHQAGDLEEAHRLYHQYLDARSDDPEAWCLLGSLEGNRGRHGEAEAAFRRAIGVAAGHAQGHIGLGTSLLMQARPAEAVQPISEAVTLAPDHPDLRLQLAMAQSKSGRPLEAVRTLREVVSRWPDHLPAHYHLGLALLEADEPDAAAFSFRRVVDGDRSNLPAFIGLGRSLAAANEPEAAADAFREAIRLAPGDPAPLTLLGNLLRRTGELEEAEPLLQQAVEQSPGEPEALVGQAELDRARGMPAQGLERRRPLLERDRPPMKALLAGARLLLDSGDAEAAVATIEDWLGLDSLTPKLAASLQSVRGQALDRLGRFDEAWAAWAESHRNDARRFDGSHFARAIDALQAAYTPDLFARLRPPPDAASPRPLLLVGAPRSGKSILEQMLACHPEIRGGGELRYLGAMTGEVQRRARGRSPYPDCIDGLNRAELDELGAA